MRVSLLIGTAVLAAASTPAVPGSPVSAPPAPAERLLPLARAIMRERPDIWAGAAVARGEHAVVVGPPGRLIADLAALADRGSRTVAAVWGTPVDAVLLVPRTTRQAAALAAPARIDGLAALASADRIIVEPSGFSRLSEHGRQVVVTHELTHIATGGAPTRNLPPWLVEGFADYVGYLDGGPLAHPGAVRTVAAELAADVRAGRAPRELPGPADFGAESPRRAQAYQEAWLACRYIAERFGERTLVALYRTARTTGVDAALRATVGTSVAGFTRSWRGYVLSRLGPSAGAAPSS